MKKCRFLFHPILFSIYPILSLYVSNINHIKPGDVVRPVLISLLFGVITLFISKLVVKDWERAGLVTSLALILVFSYGHVYNLIEGKAIAGLVIGRHRSMVCLFGSTLLLGGWWFWKKVDETRKLTEILNVVAGVALLFPMLALSSHTISQMSNTANSAAPQPTSEEQVAGSPALNNLPDVYYIILDAYGRQDVLDVVYEYDNAPFINALTERGFYVAGQSQSNYMQTILSITSSLNFNYLEEIVVPLNPAQKNPFVIDSHIKESSTRQILESLGYDTVAFNSGYPATELVHAVYYYAPASDSQEGVLNSLSNLGRMSVFETMVVQSSAAILVTDYATKCSSEHQQEGGGLLAQDIETPTTIASWLGNPCRIFDKFNTGLQYPFVKHRERILFTLDALPNLPDTDNPRFVFAHMIAPHFPFVFGPNGEVNYEPGTSHLFWHYEGTREAYITGYTDEVTYLNKRILEVVDGILATSEIEPIIIIQGDHGPDANWVGSDPFPIPGIVERFSILNAYYLPSSCSDNQLYDSISPVNSFRVVFNACFNGDYELLADRHYWSDYETPFDFSDKSKALQE